MSKINIDVQTKSKTWQNIANIKNFIEKTCQKLIKETELSKFKGNLEIAISLVSNQQIKKINHNFRGKNKATDILAFPFLDAKSIHKNGLIKTIQSQKNIYLGDIVLCLEIPRKEALKNNKTLHDHLTHLLLHAILHLIGFDHKKKQDAKKMETTEIKILQKQGIKNPYKTNL